MKKSKKYYFYDLGIRNSLLKNFSAIPDRDDIGTILESITLTELKKLQCSNVEIRFWRTKQGDEVDFLWIEDRVVVPIEVKANTLNDRVPAGLLKFMKNYPKSKWGIVVNRHRSEEVLIDGKRIRYCRVDELSKFFLVETT